MQLLDLGKMCSRLAIGFEISEKPDHEKVKESFKCKPSKLKYFDSQKPFQFSECPL